MKTLKNNDTRITIEDLQKLKNNEKRSITKIIDGFKVRAKTQLGCILIFINEKPIGYVYNVSCEEIIEIIEEHIEEEKERIEDEKERLAFEKEYYKEYKNEPYVDFSLDETKKALKSVLRPGYFSKETVALSGSEYIYIYGKKVRFSDHIRSATSKWNFIYPEDCVDAPSGIIFKKDFIYFIEKTCGITDYDEKALNSIFSQTSPAESEAV